MKKSIEQLESERDSILNKEQKEVIDWSQTGISLGVWLFFISLVIVLMVYQFTFISNLTDDNSKLIAIIVFLFITFKIVGYLGYPKIYSRIE